MNNRIKCLLFVIMLPLLAIGQDYTVESFEIVPNDLTARAKGRVDNNGRKCGLIKIYVKDVITATDGPVIGDVIDRGMEKWVYVAHDAKQIELLFKEHMPLRVTFDDFNYTTISGNMTYILKLNELSVVDSSFASTTPEQEQSTSLSMHTSAYASSTQITSEQNLLPNIPTVSGKSFDELDPVIKNLINNMVYVEGGSFMMGSDEKKAPSYEKPLHQEIVKSLYIGKYEVTQKEWKALMGNNPSNFKGDDLPVESISWEDCNEFIRKLNSLTGKNFRLPTEEEWEFSARGGTRSNGYSYSGGNDIKSVGWYYGNSGKKTHIVGAKSPNQLGLYDMCGNVHEWTSSFWREGYDKDYDRSCHVYRGGSWGSNARGCRITERRYITAFQDGNIGFRLAL